MAELEKQILIQEKEQMKEEIAKLKREINDLNYRIAVEHEAFTYYYNAYCELRKQLNIGGNNDGT